MRTKVETVTPNMARKWLEASEDFTQRGLRSRLIAKLTHAIESGQWQVTHQGIALGEVDGRTVVLDGQHRLTAIVRADTPVQVMVTRDADPAIFGVIDTGGARTPADSLRIAGHKNVTVLAAVVRSVIVYERCQGTTGAEWRSHDHEITTGDLLEWLDDVDQRDAAQQSIADGHRIAQAIARHGTITPLSAAFLLCMTQQTDITPSTRAEFVARLADGVLLGPRSPILSLRRWLIGDSGYMLTPTAGGARRMVTIANTITAMNDYALGRDRALVQFKLGTQLLPKPIEQGAVMAELMRQEADAEQREREAVDA